MYGLFGKNCVTLANRFFQVNYEYVLAPILIQNEFLILKSFFADHYFQSPALYFLFSFCYHNHYGYLDCVDGTDVVCEKNIVSSLQSIVPMPFLSLRLLYYSTRPEGFLLLFPMRVRY